MSVKTVQLAAGLVGCSMSCPNFQHEHHAPGRCQPDYLRRALGNDQEKWLDVGSSIECLPIIGYGKGNVQAEKRFRRAVKEI